MTSSDIKNYFNTHDWFKYFLLWEDENGNIHQDNRSYISAHGGVGAEHRWEKMAKKINQNVGGTIDNEGTITTYIVKDILFTNLDKIANWLQMRQTICCILQHIWKIITWQYIILQQVKDIILMTMYFLYRSLQMLH